jgi:hypothetical protein
VINGTLLRRDVQYLASGIGVRWGFGEKCSHFIISLLSSFLPFFIASYSERSRSPHGVASAASAGLLVNMLDWRARLFPACHTQCSAPIFLLYW